MKSNNPAGGPSLPGQNRAVHHPSGLTVIHVKARKGRTYLCCIDTEDYMRVAAAGPWYAREVKSSRKQYYGDPNPPVIQTYVYTKGGIALHRFILGLERGNPLVVDHWDHNGLNNRKSNIRACTLADNSKNSKFAFRNRPADTPQPCSIQ